MLLLEAEPFVKRRPLSSLKIKASDHVELDGGDSMISTELMKKNYGKVSLHRSTNQVLIRKYHYAIITAHSKKLKPFLKTPFPTTIHILYY